MSSSWSPTAVANDPEGTLALSGPQEAAWVRGATLEVLDGPALGFQRELGVEPCVLGTDASCDVILADDFVSRRHVELRPVQNGVAVVDLGSRNGTLVSGLRIERALIQEATTFKIGRTSVRVRLVGKDLAFPVSRRLNFGAALGESVAMRAVFAVLERASQSDVTVLIEGPSGTGKDVLATSLHLESKRRSGPLVVVDCGSIPENLIESELFGHQKGAFTGALQARAGAFAEARGGTLFLDEVGELPLAMQPKLLRVLESKTFRPVGGNSTIATDVRIVAATNRRLAECVRASTFREDLYYRLNVVAVRVPSLVERREDIPLLATAFLRKVSGDPHAVLPAGLDQLLMAYDWPGNARELRNVIDRFATFGSAEPALLFGLDDSGRPANAPSGGPGLSLARYVGLEYHEAKRRVVDDLQALLLPAVLEASQGNITEAARRLGIPRTSLHRLLKGPRESSDG